jgi:RNA polymerase sigma-70 factor (ECF subfamily)
VPDTVLQRIAAGQSQAVAEFIDHYSGLVWSLARRYLSARADVEDAVQEIFLEVWRCAGRFDPQAAAEATFVATIAKRRLIDRSRKRARQPPTEQLDRALEAAAITPADQVEVSEELSRVRGSLKRLPEDEQRVLRLAFIEGLTHREISETTSLPLGSVKTHARRGLTKLRKMLGKSSDTDPLAARGEP